MPNKKFLEEFPLYKKMVIPLKPYYRSIYVTEGAISDLKKVSINAYCPFCASSQTFNMTNQYYQNSTDANENPLWRTFRLNYSCAGCNQGEILFFVEFGQTLLKDKKQPKVVEYWIRKVGQNPAWEIKMDKDLENLLGVYKPFYKKGLINESQGYGIGAYSYYRRITEEIIDDLLEKIYLLIEEQDKKEDYKKALQQVKKTKIAEEKLNLVKDLLPQTLRPEGLNPLNILYKSLSQGIHNESDEGCLVLAGDIKKVLIYLVGQVFYHRKISNEFTESMRKLLELKSKKI